MNKKKLEIFENLLLQKKRELLAKLMHNSDEYHEYLKEKVGDVADFATDSYEQYLVYSLSIAEKEQLENINHALSKIENSTYGLCESCNKEISEERLKIVPEAKYCIECQRKKEFLGT